MPLVATKLPLNCEADYYPDFMSKADSDALFRSIHSGYSLSPRIFKTATGEDFQQDFGAMMFVDQKLTDEFSEEIWGGELSLFRPCLRIYALQIEDTTHRELPVCRCIYYEDGSVGADYHADLPAYGNLSCIASISLGRNGNSRSVALRTKTISTAST